MRDQGLTCSSCCAVQLGLPNGPSIAIWHPQTEKVSGIALWGIVSTGRLMWSGREKINLRGGLIG